MASTATDLKITVQCVLEGYYNKLATDGLNVGTQRCTFPTPKMIEFTYGTGTNQINFYGEKILALAGGTQSIDFVSGAFADPYGQTAVLTKLKILFVHNKASTAGHILTLQGNHITGGTYGTQTTQTLGPGEFRFVCLDPIDGKTITNAANDTLTFNPGANTYNVDVVVGGIM